MLTDQNRTCAICKNPFETRPEVDHDHGTGRVRGLLCGNCNKMLGHARDNVSVLNAAIQYLQRIDDANVSARKQHT